MTPSITAEAPVPAAPLEDDATISDLSEDDESSNAPQLDLAGHLSNFLQSNTKVIIQVSHLVLMHDYI